MRKTEHRIGKYVADYVPLTHDELAKRDVALDELYASSKPVKHQEGVVKKEIVRD